MIFDMTVQIADSEAALLEHDGVPHGVQMSYMLAGALPVGQGQIMPFPAGWVRMGMTKKGAIEHAEAILAIANQIPDEEEKPKADILIANDMKAVEQVAKHTEGLKKGKK